MWVKPVELSKHVKRLAAEVGFNRCGITTAEPIGRADYFRAWLAGGRAGSMSYLHRYFNERTDPRALLRGARSVIVVALSYHQPTPVREADGYVRGRVARYAWGEDYHVVLRRKLSQMIERLRGDVPESSQFRVCVDTAPLIEREFAARAGIGWIGKNTMALNQELGSYFFLGAIVTTLELAPDAPAVDHCGSCTACLDACPTKAFPQPYEMDASRCISYLTIEHRREIPEEFQPAIGDWLFGCDVCQEVCPFNRHAPTTVESAFTPRSPNPAPSVDEVLSWSAGDYSRELRGSAMKRAKLDMLQRNARIIKENDEESKSQNDK